MYLFIGLGNPGKEYVSTRHNAGRDIVMSWCKKEALDDIRADAELTADIARGLVAGQKAVCILPNTMMNKSGAAVAKASSRYKIKPEKIVVVHDDADISVGNAKMSFGKHSAGHKGVESVIRALKTRDFWRIRIGIAGKRDIPAEKIVLKKWTPEEAALIKKTEKRAIAALAQILADGPEKAMMEFNTRSGRKNSTAKSRR